MFYLPLWFLDNLRDNMTRDNKFLKYVYAVNNTHIFFNVNNIFKLYETLYENLLMLFFLSPSLPGHSHNICWIKKRNLLLQNLQNLP